MRRLLRRLAWLFARLLLVVVLSFIVLANATERGWLSGADYSSDRLEESELPQLLNLQPNDLAMRVRTIVHRLSRVDTAHDARELQRLGGASFPLVIPMLSGMPEAARCRVAAALLPVAKRMAWRDVDELKPDACAADYLTDAWMERSVDFQLPIVARWVERFANRGGAALSASVLEYDTYALPALMERMPEIVTVADVERARQLMQVARRVTGLPWSIAPGASIPEARKVTNHWRRWWQLHAVEYTVVQGPSRWSAMLRQTQFGQWFTLAVNHRFGMTKDQQAISNELGMAVVRSLVLLVAATFGAMVAAVSRSRWQARSPAQRQYVVMTWIIASLPDVSLIAWLSRLQFGAPTLTACATAAIAMSLFVLGSEDGVIHAPDPHRAPSVGDTTREVERFVRRQLPLWVFAGHTWPFLLTLVFVVEKAFQVQGLGAICVNAFRQRDLHMLMAITTTTALWLLLVEFAVQLGRIFADPLPAEERPS